MEHKLIKVEAEELSKVKDNLLNGDQLAFLFNPTPEDHTYTRPAKGGGKWTYVTGTYVKKVLNLIFGWDWSFEVVKHEVSLEFKQVVVLGRLTVRSNGREIVKMQFGRQDIKFKKDAPNQPLDIGNELKGATTDALKKCASELGIASDIYAPNEYKQIEIVREEDKDWDKIGYAYELLRTSSYDDDTKDIISIKITKADHEELETLVADLKDAQPEVLNPSMKQIRQKVKDKVDNE